MNTALITNSQPLPNPTALQSQPHPESTSSLSHAEDLDNRTTTAALEALSSSLERRSPTDQCDSYLDILPAFVQNYILSFLEYPELRRSLPAFIQFQDGIPECVLEPFGLPRLKTENKEIFSWEINIILDTLKNSSFLNPKEKAFFDHFTAENLFTNQNSLYYVLDSAYECSLVAPFLPNVSLDLLENTPLEEMVNCVREYIEKNKELIVNLEYIGREMICFPDELCSSLPHLKWLNLSNSRITSLPESIIELSALESLNLSTNDLSSLPESFGNLSSLWWLDLSNNLLSSLPESFGNLSSLKELCLFGNQLSSLPESFGNLSSLWWLSLFKNQLTSLPKSFGALVTLKKLYLSDNHLTLLSESFGNLSTLDELDLSNNQLSSLPESIKRFLKQKGFDPNEILSKQRAKVVNSASLKTNLLSLRP